MVWEVSVQKSKHTVFSYLIEADSVREATEKAEKFGEVVGVKLSETMND